MLIPCVHGITGGVYHTCPVLLPLEHVPVLVDCLMKNPIQNMVPARVHVPPSRVTEYITIITK